MKNNKECDIVKDIIPIYIEKLTSTTTNEFIKKHIKECPQCREILENMEKNIKIDNDTNEEKHINILKKYNFRMNLLKLLVIVIVIIIFILGGFMYHNYKVYSTILEAKKTTMTNCNNINNLQYKKIVNSSYSTNNDLEIKETEVFFKDNISGTINKNNEGTTISKTLYNSETKELTHIDFINKKVTIQENVDSDYQTIEYGKKILPQINYIDSENNNLSFFEFLTYWILKPIKTTNIDGVSYYVIEENLNDETKIQKYINQATGIESIEIVNYPDGNYTRTDYTDFKFDSVDDSYIEDTQLNDFEYIYLK